MDAKTKKQIVRFEDLPVWQDAQEFAVTVYMITRRFPAEEKYGLTSQIRRSASSISANIAEGFGRQSKKDQAHFYHIAFGSLLETKNFLYLSARLSYIDDVILTSTIADSNKVHKQITAILKYFRNHG